MYVKWSQILEHTMLKYVNQTENDKQQFPCGYVLDYSLAGMF